MYFFTKRKKVCIKERKKLINYPILDKIWLSYRYFCQF